MAQKSRVKGVAQLRRTLRTMPDFVRDGMADALRDSGQRLLARAKAETPRRTGQLSSALLMRVAPKSLNLKIGLLTKGKRRRFFYGYILDQGRRAQVVQAKRRTKTGYVTYPMKVRGIGQGDYEFVFGRRQDFRVNELPRIRRRLEDLLSRVARGGGVSDG